MTGLTRCEVTMSAEVLDGVSATALWTLHNRATEAKRPDGVITDPWAVRLFDALSYDYSKFGKPSQSHALRGRAFDAAATEYMNAHPNAVVVALAEGLQTSFWRLDSAGLIDEVQWYSVDLAPVIALRQQLLPRDARIVELAQSALDRNWMDSVDPSNGVFLTAEGLLMYLQPADVLSLIHECARRFPGGQMIFDSIPHWLSRRTLKGWKLSPRYVTPPMPFGLNTEEARELVDTVAGVVAAVDVAMPAGRGLFKWITRPVLDQIGWWRRNRPSITLLEFG
jgi:O-methyltransferase involved in polyketide biosynthesis